MRFVWKFKNKPYWDEIRSTMQIEHKLVIDQTCVCFNLYRNCIRNNIWIFYWIAWNIRLRQLRFRNMFCVFWAYLCLNSIANINFQLKQAFLCIRYAMMTSIFRIKHFLFILNFPRISQFSWIFQFSNFPEFPISTNCNSLEI